MFDASYLRFFQTDDDDDIFEDPFYDPEDDEPSGITDDDDLFDGYSDPSDDLPPDTYLRDLERTIDDLESLVRQGRTGVDRGDWHFRIREARIRRGRPVSVDELEDFIGSGWQQGDSTDNDIPIGSLLAYLRGKAAEQKTLLSATGRGVIRYGLSGATGLFSDETRYVVQQHKGAMRVVDRFNVGGLGIRETDSGEDVVSRTAFRYAQQNPNLQVPVLQSQLLTKAIASTTLRGFGWNVALGAVRAFTNRSKSRARDTALGVAEWVLNEANKTVPFRTGALMRSGHVRLDDSDEKNPFSYVAYSAHYAGFQHENIRFDSSPSRQITGRRAKWLELTIMENRSEINALVRRGMLDGTVKPGLYGRGVLRGAPPSGDQPFWRGVRSVHYNKKVYR